MKRPSLPIYYMYIGNYQRFKFLLRFSIFVACEQAHLFGWGAASESWREEWGFSVPHSFSPASLVLGTQTSEPARRLQYLIQTVLFHVIISLIHDAIRLAQCTTKSRFENANCKFIHDQIPKAKKKRIHTCMKKLKDATSLWTFAQIRLGGEFFSM